MHQKKKEKTSSLTKRSLLIGGLILLTVGGGVGIKLYHTKQQVTQALANYKKNLKKQDYEAFVDLFTKESFTKSGFTKKEALAKYQAVFSALGTDKVAIKKWDVKKEADDSYAVSYKLDIPTNLGTISDEAYRTKMVKIDNEWQFEWAPDLIFEEMSGKDTVKITQDTAKRGKIYDRYGKAFATDHAYQELGLVPEKLGEGDIKAKNLKAISQLFDVEVATLEKALEPEWATGQVFVPIKVLLEEVTTDQLPSGVLLRDKTMRYYPLGEAAAHLIGYTGKATAEDIEKNNQLSAESIIGKTGLESAFDKELRGQEGGNIQIQTENNETKRVVLENKKIDGQDITLTLDATAQTKAFASLKNQPGQVVVNAPTSGELLVATSSPAFDPNKMTVGISQTDYEAYQNDTNLPFIARYATNYAPGSTFKTLTAAIALDAGTLTTDETLAIDGLKWQKDASWGGYFVTRVKDVPSVNLEKALVYSDNIFFAQKTLALGEKAFRAGLSKFIFDETLELPLAVPKATISNAATFASDILLADTGYGQGELMIAPLTQLSMYSVLMNDGDLVYPRLVQSSEEPKIKEHVISSESATIILDDLVGVVANSDGYAHNIYQDQRVIAAKTGTAEIKEQQDTTGKENSFLLFMDKEQKQFMGLILSEDSRKNGTATEKATELVDYLSQTY